MQKILDHQIKEIIEEYATGKTSYELAHQYGCAPSSICRLLARNGIVARKGNSKFYDYKAEIIEAYTSGMTMDMVGKKLNLDMGYVHKILKKNNVKINSLSPLIRDNKLPEIISSYISGKSSYEIAIEYNADPSTISRLLRLSGVPENIYAEDANKIRKYSYNYNFFDVIDTQEKAYVLGIMAADGCNLEKKASIRLVDEHIVRDIARVMGFSDDAVKYFPPRIKNRQDMFGLVMFSRHLCEQLTEKGLPKQKTFKLKFPTSDIIPDDLIRHFVRGYFDGDGSVFYRRSRNKVYLSASFVGTENFILGLRNIIPFHSIMKPDENVFELRLNLIDGIEWLKNWMYNDATIFLERKRNKFFDSIPDLETFNERRFAKKALKALNVEV